MLYSKLLNFLHVTFHTQQVVVIMKNEKILILILILTGINFGYSQQTIEQNCSGDYPTYYTTTLVYLYQERDSESAIIGEVPNGNAVKVESSFLGSVSGFWSICYKGKSGFAKKNQLSYKKVSSTEIESNTLSNSENTSSNQDVRYDQFLEQTTSDGDLYATSFFGNPGSGSETGGYGLSGRSLVNKGKVQQECNESGTVVVKIVVDRNGKVISATPGVRGTTNNSPCLLEPAKKTAFMHKWNLDSNAPSQQVGFVVVNFKLGE